MNIVAIIPARGGSKGIKDKNIINFCGKPLIYWTIKAAQDSKFINKIVVSTDSKKIKKIVEKYNIKVAKLRPKKLSTNDATTHSVIVYEVKQIEKKNYFPEIIVTLQPTSPLRNNKHIDEAITKFLRNKKADSLVSCLQVKHNFNPESLMQIKNNYLYKTVFSKKINSRHNKKKYYARNGASIYISRRKIIEKCIFNEKTIPFEMSRFVSTDIDTEDDLIEATLFKNHHKKNEKKDR
tara:strand:+ start:12 stop:722 length:711 start_codon:yes stop_codon:yes gene_type:complete